MRLFRLRFILPLVVLSAFLAPVAFAQEENSHVDPFAFRTPSSLFNREVNADPFEYRGEPVKMGSFLIWPNITWQKEYSTNILATEDGEESDIITVIKPEVIVKKNIRNHEFILSLNTELRHYWDNSDENVENYRGRFEGNFQARHGINIPVMLSYRDGHLRRRDQNRINNMDLSVEPLHNTALEAETGIIYKPKRLLLSLMGNYREARLKNSRARNGTTLIRENRNVNTAKAVTTIGYDVSENLTPYAELTYAQEDYIDEPVTAASRNNDLTRFLVGANFDYRGLIIANIGVGLEERNYDSATVNNADSLSFDGNLKWQVDQKTALGFDLSRQTYEDNVIIAGLTKTEAGVSINHEILRDTFLRSHLKYEFKEYDNITREDTTYDAGLEILYIINPHFQLGADYNYITRDSNIQGLSMDENIFMIRARTAL